MVFKIAPLRTPPSPAGAGKFLAPGGSIGIGRKWYRWGLCSRRAGGGAGRVQPGRKVCQWARPCLCRHHAAVASQAAGLLRPCATRRIGAPLSAPRNEWRGETNIFIHPAHTLKTQDRPRGAGKGRPAIPPPNSARAGRQPVRPLCAAQCSGNRKPAARPLPSLCRRFTLPAPVPSFARPSHHYRPARRKSSAHLIAAQIPRLSPCRRRLSILPAPQEPPHYRTTESKRFPQTFYRESIQGFSL